MDKENIMLSDEFKAAMKEWVELKKTLAEARSDMKGLNTREKNLKTYIKGVMSAQKIDTCNLRKGKVSLKKKTSKKAITKETIEKGLLTFFEGDQQRTQAAIESINNQRETVESEVLSATGLKDKPEE